MDGKPGSSLLLHNVPGVLCERILLVGLGKEREFRDRQYREAVQLSIRQVADIGIGEITLYLSESPSRSGIWPGRWNRPSSPRKKRCTASTR
jgi:leucyl aminopeptidase